MKQQKFNKWNLTLFLLLMSTIHGIAQTQLKDKSSFITTWNTSNLGTSSNTEITIPIIGIYDADWDNDGEFDAFDINGKHTHDFKTSGIHIIRLRNAISNKGTIEQIFFNNEGDPQKLIKINQWGSTSWKSMGRAFYGCLLLDVDANDTPDLSHVNSLNQMFHKCKKLIGNTSFNEWNVSEITNMSKMFNQAIKFNQNIGRWIVINVTDMSGMFSNANTFNQNIGSWKVNNVANMNSMFDNATRFNQNIGEWKVSRVTDMSSMFSNATAFNQNINEWDVENVTNMNRMFDNATVFNQNIGEWNVKNVFDMSYMFHKASAFNQYIGKWNVCLFQPKSIPVFQSKSIPL